MGPHHHSNIKKLEVVSDRDWLMALDACRNHIKWRLKQKTWYGAHTEKNLDIDPHEYYLNYAYQAILSGSWEWKSTFNLAQQLIRIVDSQISTEVEKYILLKKKVASNENKPQEIVSDIEKDFYFLPAPDVEISKEQEEKFNKHIVLIESSINGDDTLEFIWECIKEGKKRKEIADLLDITPKQFDKQKERFIRVVTNNAKTIK